MLSGWAELRGRPGTVVRVFVNDSLVVETKPATSRPDVARVLGIPEECGPFGWSTEVDLSDVVGSTACLRTEVLLPTGRWWPVGSVTVGTLDPPSLFADGTGSLDLPTEDQQIVGDVVPVQGWAIFGAELPAWLDVAIDGEVVGRARAQLPRPDVLKATHMPSGLAAGFEYYHSLDLAPGESRAVIVEVTAHHQSGLLWSVPPRRCVVSSPGVSNGAIEQMQTRLEPVALSLSHRSSLDPRRLLVFTHSLALGGGQLFLNDLLARLHRDHGIQCAVAAPSDGPLRAELEALGISVHLLGDYPVGTADAYEEGVRRVASLARDYGAATALVNTLGLFPAVDAARLVGMEVIWTIHESFHVPEFVFLNWGPAGLEPTIRQRWSDAMLGVSLAVFECEATSRLFAAHIPAARRLVIPYGIPLEEIRRVRQARDRTALRRSLGIPADALLLLAMGVYEPRKSQASLVEAFARIASTYPTTRLVLVGYHPSQYSDGVMRLVQLHGLQDRITCVPIAMDVYDWYVVADGLISASDVESVPRSMLEAMAFGVPVIAGAAHGVSELVRHGYNGWTFPTRNFASLTAAMIRFATSSLEERLRISDRALDLASRFDASLYADDYSVLVAALGRGQRESLQDLVRRRTWRLPDEDLDRVRD